MSVMLRPLSLGELLDRAFQLYRSRFSLFVGISAIAYLPMFVVRMALLWVPKHISPSQIVATLVGWIIVCLMMLVAMAAASSATVVAVSVTYLEQPITLGEAYSRVSGMLGKVALMMVGMGLAIFFGFLFFIVPGVLMALAWALAIPVAVLENASFRQSLSRSAALTSGHRMRVLGIFLLYYALIFVLDMALVAPIGVLAVIKKGPLGPMAVGPLIIVASSIVNYIIESLVTPIVTICLSLMYYDERVRKEAFDIHLMMSSISDNPAGATASAS